MNAVSVSSSSQRTEESKHDVPEGRRHLSPVPELADKFKASHPALTEATAGHQAGSPGGRGREGREPAPGKDEKCLPGRPVLPAVRWESQKRFMIHVFLDNGGDN